MHQIWKDIGITWEGAAAVCLSSVCMYVALTLVLHWWGERIRASSSSTTMALAALIGAISARASLGNHPTLGGGLVALATLLVMERLFGHLGRASRSARRRTDRDPS